MDLGHALRSIAGGVWLIAIAAVFSASAEGTFDIAAGRASQPAQARPTLQRLSLRDQISSAKIPGAIVLIQQHGKPVYLKIFGVRDVGPKHCR